MNEDWEIKIPADFEIKNIWNAKVVSEQDSEYVIHNADWNHNAFQEFVYLAALSGQNNLVKPQFKLEGWSTCL